MLKRLGLSLARVLVTLLVMAALLLSVARLWVPTLGSYRDEIATLASSQLGRTVLIRELQATWRGLSPVIKLIGVRIASREVPGERLDIGQIWVRIDLRSYLLEHELRFIGVDLIGTDFTLERTADGSLQVKELPLSARPGIDITAMSRLSLHDAGITWIDNYRQRPSLRFSDVSVVLRNNGDRHVLAARVSLPDSIGHMVEAEAQLQGTSPDPREWQGRIYVRGSGLRLGALAAEWNNEARALHGTADIRAWAELAAGAPVAASAELNVVDFTVPSEHAGGSALSVDTLQTQLGWQRRTYGWQAALQQFRMSAGTQVWTIGNLSVSAVTRDQVNYLHAVASRLPLEGLRGLVAVAPGLPKEWRHRLLELQPSGELEDVSLALRQLPDQTVIDAFATRFHALGVSQSGAVPALSGLSGSVSGSPRAGQLQLACDATSYHDARLFRTALQFDHLSGRLDWQQRDDALHIAADELQLDNDHLALTGRFRLDIPDAPDAPALDLQVEVPHAAVSRVHDYLPALIMSPVAVTWLDRSLTGGAVQGGSAVIRGRLDQLPFDHGEGTLEIRLPVRSATLNFDPSWSPVEDLDAQVDFTGRSMDILSSKGRIRSAALQDVRAQIADLAQSHLTIRGDVSGALGVMLEELGSSPLGETYGGFVDRVHAGGDAGLHLDINIPLALDHLPITVAGRVSLHDNTLALRDTGISLDRIRGRLDFSDNGINGEKLTARLFKQPVRARAWTETRRHQTWLELEGKLPLFAQLLPKDAPLRAVFSGDSDWQALLALRGTPARGKRADVGLEIRSTLEGTAIDLPAPLGKPAQTARELSFRSDDLEQDMPELFVRYADGFDAVLQLQAGKQGTLQLQRGAITLGTDRAALPEHRELLLAGDLARLRLEDWLPYLEGGGDGFEVPLRLALQVQALELFGYVMQDTHLDVRKDGRQWVVDASGDPLQGQIRLTPGDAGLERVVMNLERLKLQSLPDQGDTAMSGVRPAQFPNLHVDAGQLVYNGADFGALMLIANRRPDGRIDIPKLALDSAMLALNVKGEWYEQDARDRTRVDLAISGGNLGNLLDALGYEKFIRNGDMTGSLQASWPGAPWEGKSEKMDGKLSLVIKNGQLLDVEPGATGRALGLLSIGRLPRRLLMLDFTDLFGKGFAFDRIGGDLVLDSGNAWTDNLVVEGSAAKLDITGRVGLRAQDYDEQVTVTPYLNSSLPLAGALAGGPAVGAAVIVAEKLLENSRLGLNEMARKQYNVTGSWAEPVITPVNTKTPDSKPTDNHPNH